MPPGSRKEPIQHTEIIHFHFVIMTMTADGRVLSYLIPILIPRLWFFLWSCVDVRVGL